MFVIKHNIDMSFMRMKLIVCNKSIDCIDCIDCSYEKV